jgi:TatD DNase family protein
MQFVDTHCHIHFDDYLPDVEQVLNDAHTSRVNKMICVGVSLEDSQKAVDFANMHDNVWATVGAHPHDGADFLNHTDAERKLLELIYKPAQHQILKRGEGEYPYSEQQDFGAGLSKNEKVVAIGEIGLDYFHEYTPRQKQIDVLSKQLEFGAKTDLPFIFHVRDAWEDFWKILDSCPNIKGVIHCFSAHEEQLREILKRGFYVGLNGIMTFTKDDMQLEAAKKVPLDKMLLETDAPFLTPKPHRGKRCEPKHVVLTAEFLANLRGEGLEEVAAVTTKNAEELFKI